MRTEVSYLAACAAAVAAFVSVGAVANVPEPRNVPELMSTFRGEHVKTIAEWEGVRAPEILERYRREVFGVRPKEADERGRVSFKMRDVREVMDGKAVRKVLDVMFDGPMGQFSFPVTAFIPKSPERVPAFVLACNVKRSTVDADGALSSPFWPVGDIVGRGFATVAFVIGDVAPDDKKPDFDRAVFRSVQNVAERSNESWASISAWAWAASRVMDWIETEPLIDSAHVGVVGHSRCGKTAIWAVVNDRRFAMACSNNSGCTGAKLNHIFLTESESISKVTRNFPHWFCRNYNKYAKRDREMDFDQHELLALVAPRLLCVASATEDHWAGQRGEWWGGEVGFARVGTLRKEGSRRRFISCPRNAAARRMHIVSPADRQTFPVPIRLEVLYGFRRTSWLARRETMICIRGARVSGGFRRGSGGRNLHEVEEHQPWKFRGETPRRVEI